MEMVLIFNRTKALTRLHGPIVAVLVSDCQPKSVVDIEVFTMSVVQKLQMVVSRYVSNYIVSYRAIRLIC